MGLSHAVVLFIDDEQADVAALKTDFSRQGSHFVAYRAEGVTIVHATIDSDDPEALLEEAEAFAKRHQVAVGHLWGEAGFSVRQLATYFHGEQVQRVRARAYWKLHTLFRFEGKTARLDLSATPALEVLARWPRVAAWPEEEAPASTSGLGARLDVALADLARQCAGETVLWVHAEGAGLETRLEAGTQRSLDAATEQWRPRSTLVRVSPLAARQALFQHADARACFVNLAGRFDVDEEELLVAAIERHFPSMVVQPEDETDPEANAWNALIELTPAQVLDTWAEEDADSRRRLFGDQLAAQLTAFLVDDAATFAPLIVDRLLAGRSELRGLRWVLDEPSAKKLSRDRVYAKRLAQLSS